MKGKFVLSPILIILLLVGIVVGTIFVAPLINPSNNRILCNPSMDYYRGDGDQSIGYLPGGSCYCPIDTNEATWVDNGDGTFLCSYT